MFWNTKNQFNTHKTHLRWSWWTRGHRIKLVDVEKSTFVFLQKGRFIMAFWWYTGVVRWAVIRWSRQAPSTRHSGMSHLFTTILLWQLGNAITRKTQITALFRGSCMISSSTSSCSTGIVETIVGIEQLWDAVRTKQERLAAADTVFVGRTDSGGRESRFAAGSFQQRRRPVLMMLWSVAI